MVLKFWAENVFSFKNKIMFDLTASKLKEINQNSVVNDNYRALKTAYIFGFVGTGKSNLVKAINILRAIILNSFEEDLVSKVKPFLFEEGYENKISNMGLSLLFEGVEYIYDLSISNGKIVEETLFRKIERKTPIYRRYDNRVDGLDEFNTNFNIINQFLKPTFSVASLVKKFDLAVLHPFIKAVESTLVVKTEVPATTDTVSYINNQAKKDKVKLRALKQYFSRIGLDIQELVTDNEPEKSIIEIDKNGVKKERNTSLQKLYVIKNIYNEKKDVINTYKYPVELESQGIKKLINLAGIILIALDEGRTIIIDEFSEKIHPEIVRRIFKIFESSITNPNNAQLIITSHHVSLLQYREQRRDQVWFTDKDEYGNSSLKRISDYESRLNPRILENLLIQPKEKYHLSYGYNNRN